METETHADLEHKKGMPGLIGIRGCAGHGKDSLGAEIRRMYPEYQIRKYAASLRRVANIITDIPVEDMQSSTNKAMPLPNREYKPADLAERIVRAVQEVTGTTAPPKTVFAIAERLTGTSPGGWDSAILSCRIASMTIGRLLQVLGTECFRTLVGEDVWVDATLNAWRAAGRPPTVITDVRFPNESAAIRAAGGVVILVVREAGKTADGREDSHASEHALDAEEPDVVIYNDSTLAQLAGSFGAALPRLCALSAERQTAARSDT